MEPTNTLTFTVTLTFSDPLDCNEALEVRDNIQTALNHWRDVSNLSPADGEAFTEDVEISFVANPIRAAKETLSKAGYLSIYWSDEDIRGYELGENGYDEKGNVIEFEFCNNLVTL